jgi:putative intracellular protease/amidase
MHIAILTFEGFNELDSLIAFGLLNRVKKPDWRVCIASPGAKVRSMNGLVLEAQCSLQDAAQADAVIVGSGMQTREVVADTGFGGREGRLRRARHAKYRALSPWPRRSRAIGRLTSSTPEEHT